jgi:hypothetical protein
MSANQRRRFNVTHLVKSLLNRNLLALVASTAALAPQALKAEEARCPLGNATLHGTYVVTGTGTIVGVGPIAAVGEITYDGNGNTNATYTASVNGTIHMPTVTGIYMVNSDCTGSHHESDNSHYNFVVTPDGSTVWWIRIDAGFVTSGTIVRLRHLFD